MKMENKFSQSGGARLDTFNATWPFAKFCAGLNNIKLGVFRKEYMLNKNEIIGLRRYNGIFSKGLLIEHSRKDYPHHMVFWTFSFGKLKKGIEGLGYSIGEPKKSDSWSRGGP
jgi:hypothetical protein